MLFYSKSPTGWACQKCYRRYWKSNFIALFFSLKVRIWSKFLESQSPMVQHRTAQCVRRFFDDNLVNFWVRRSFFSFGTKSLRKKFFFYILCVQEYLYNFFQIIISGGRKTRKNKNRQKMCFLLLVLPVNLAVKPCTIELRFGCFQPNPLDHTRTVKVIGETG